MRRQSKIDEDNAGHSKQKDILVSIILTESTSSLLSLDVPNLEDCAHVEQSSCFIRPLSSNEISKRSSLFSYIFGFGQDRFKDDEDITTEFAFFSDHFNAESASNVDVTEDNNNEEDGDWYPDDNTFLSDDEIIEPMERNLQLARVYMKPLVNAKTIVHGNKFSFEDNEIVVNLINQDEDNTSVSSELICRICHGGESAGDLLRPCRCRGTIALVHIDCLEHWLRESANSHCELCKHHFRIVRQPRYGLLWSVFVYLSDPGENLRDVVLDLLAFIFYTPSAIITTYMLMVICENMAKAHINRTRNLSAHLVAFCAIFGMAAIDFTYSSWLILTFQRHMISWRSWYRNNSYLRLILPEHKRKSYTKKNKVQRKSAGNSRNPDDSNAFGGLSTE